MPLARRYKADIVLQTKIFIGMWAIYNMDGRVNYLDGNQYAQVFSNGTYFAEIYPMDRKADVRYALKTFLMGLVVPEEITVHGSKEQNSPGTEFMKCFWRNDISLTRTKPERTNQNTEERVVREVQRRWFQTMIRNIVPRKLWYYGVQWTTQVIQRTSTQSGGLRGTFPFQDVTG